MRALEQTILLGQCPACGRDLVLAYRAEITLGRPGPRNPDTNTVDVIGTAKIDGANLAHKCGKPVGLPVEDDAGVSV